MPSYLLYYFIVEDKLVTISTQVQATSLCRMVVWPRGVWKYSLIS